MLDEPVKSTVFELEYKQPKNLEELITAWKKFKYGVISGPYFAALGLNTEIYRVKYRKIRSTGEYGPEKTPYLGTFHAENYTYLGMGYKAI